MHRDKKQPSKTAPVKKYTQKGGAIDLMRLGTVLLAAVSFWATAQGMAEYVFAERWQAYAASLAIQGILLSLNFYLPAFMKSLTQNWMKFVVSALAFVVLFCSSWFSFIYIVGQAYGLSWDVESRLLIQSTYREQLYSASDYADFYRDLLRDDLNEQILSLYDQAKTLGESTINTMSDINWADEREQYTNADFAAKSIMTSIINAMEAVTDPNATAATQERSTEIVIQMRINLQTTISSLNTQLQSANASVEQANTNLQNTQARLNYVPEGVDTTGHLRAIDSAMTNLQTCMERQQNLQNQLNDYQGALSRVQQYEANLGLASDGSSNVISASLRTIQQELFRDEPDLDSLEKQAISIFDELQTASNVSTAEEGAEYMTLLNSSNRFINDLRTYRLVSSTGAQFDELLEDLRDSSAAIVNANGTWKNEWFSRLDGLKSLISSLPAYDATAMARGSDLSLDETTRFETLENYDRARSADTLDDMIRLYIADHNAAQQGLIYLFSPYRALAIFSLILAFLLDISAFITGFVIDNMENKPAHEEGSAPQDSTSEAPQGDAQNDSNHHDSENPFHNLCDNDDEMYEPIPCWNHYIYLTGDYLFEDDKAVYHAIIDGEDIELELPGTGFSEGIYLQSGKQVTQLPETEQNPRFLNNPCDGIFHNCCLKYQEYALMISHPDDAEYQFAANIDPDIPVYQFDKKNFDIIPAHTLRGQDAKTVVLALNRCGSMVAAVFMQ